MARFALLLPLGLALGTYWLFPWKRIPSSQRIHRSATSGVTVAARPAGLGPERAVYRYSVIPGGAYSVSELQRAERRDAVVAAHYARFDHANLRMVQNPAARAVYVSYRVGEAVYWTRGRVHLAAAETLITDGKYEARARCGNQVSDTPRQPTLVARQTPLAELDQEERVLSATASGVEGQPAPLLAQEIIPPPAPMQMAVPGAAPDVEGGLSGSPSVSGGFAGGFAAWGGGTSGGLVAWPAVAPQAPVGQIPVPRAPQEPLPQTIPVVWVATSDKPFPTPGLIPSASASESTPPSLPPVLTGPSYPPSVPFVAPSEVYVPPGRLPESPAPAPDNPSEGPGGGGGEQPASPLPSPDTPTPEPGTGPLAAAGALAVAGLAALRRRRNRGA